MAAATENTTTAASATWGTSTGPGQDGGSLQKEESQGAAAAAAHKEEEDEEWVTTTARALQGVTLIGGEARQLEPQQAGQAGHGSSHAGPGDGDDGVGVAEAVEDVEDINDFEEEDEVRQPHSLTEDDCLIRSTVILNRQGYTSRRLKATTSLCLTLAPVAQTTVDSVTPVCSTCHWWSDNFSPSHALLLFTAGSPAPRSQLGASGTYLTAEEPSDSEILRTRTYDLTIT